VRCERRPKQGAGVSHQAVSVGSTAVARAGLRNGSPRLALPPWVAERGGGVGGIGIARSGAPTFRRRGGDGVASISEVDRLGSLRRAWAHSNASPHV
jgi:hypothetical protein